MPISETQLYAINFLVEAHTAFPLASNDDLVRNIEKAIVGNAPPPLTNVPRGFRSAVVRLIPPLDRATRNDTEDKTSIGAVKSVAKEVFPDNQDYLDFVSKL